MTNKKTVKKKATNKYRCEVYDYDKDRECGLVAKYECNFCGMKVCKKHERESWGECPDCEPPGLREIQ